jgi:threonine dehydrogenase-like Zn-dependent dehydrogenase
MDSRSGRSRNDGLKEAASDHRSEIELTRRDERRIFDAPAKGTIPVARTTWRVDMNEHSSAETGARLVKPVDGAPFIEGALRPTPGRGEALVRVATVGMCRTDLLVAAGTIPVCADTVLGHEFSGWIEDVGPDTICAFAPGTLVAGDPTFPLPDGRDGFMGVDAPGALTTWLTIPVERLHRADGLTPHEAAYLEPVTAAMGGLPVAKACGGRGAIIGRNRIATLTSAVLTSHGVEHEILDMNELWDRPDCSFEWLLEARLSDLLLADAVRKLAAGGTLILKSRHLESATFPVRDMVLKRLSFVGMTRSGFPEAMEWMKANRDVVASLLGDRYRMANWRKAFAAAETGEGRKIFVDVAADA